MVKPTKPSEPQRLAPKGSHTSARAGLLLLRRRRPSRRPCSREPELKKHSVIYIPEPKFSSDKRPILSDRNNAERVGALVATPPDAGRKLNFELAVSKNLTSEPDLSYSVRQG
jgi:hypothetical protein